MSSRLPIRELVALALVILLVVGASLKEPRFLAAENLNSILLWLPLILVAAMGEFLVIVTRGIDISVGSILGFTGIAVGEICKGHPNVSIPVLVFAGALIGAILGLVNGVLVSWAKLSPVVVTIGTLTIFRGCAFLLSGGDEIDPSMVPDSLTNLAKTGLALGHVTISWLLILALIVTLLTGIFAKFSVAGRNVFAFGSNPDAAPLRGISVKTVLLTVYVFSGFAAGLAGVLYIARFGFVNPGSAGQNFELNVIAAVAVGGVKMSGGYGSVWGVFLGCLLLSCINVALSVLGVEADWQMITYGALILLALGSDAFFRRMAENRKSASMTLPAGAK